MQALALVTVTPGITPPVASVTLPLIAPVVAPTDCASAGPEVMVMNPTNTVTIRSRLMVAPSITGDVACSIRGYEAGLPRHATPSERRMQSGSEASPGPGRFRSRVRPNSRIERATDLQDDEERVDKNVGSGGNGECTNVIETE